MLIVRQANESDLEDIYKIEKATFGNSLEVWSKDGILFSITDESYKVFVCELDKIVGYIIMTYSPYEAYISKIVIDSDFRGVGYGCELLDYVLKMVKTEIFSLEVRSKNLTAINLYTKMGFVKEGIRNNMYFSPDDDAVIMIKKVD